MSDYITDEIAHLVTQAERLKAISDNLLEVDLQLEVDLNEVRERITDLWFELRGEGDGI